MPPSKNSGPPPIAQPQLAVGGGGGSCEWEDEEPGLEASDDEVGFFIFSINAAIIIILPTAGVGGGVNHSQPRSPSGKPTRGGAAERSVPDEEDGDDGGG